MNATWASGAIELLEHADGHINLTTAFDKRIAFISIDNAVETSIKIYLSLPNFGGTSGPSKREVDECNNSFSKYLLLLEKYASKKLVGIEIADIEFFHRIRNKLYHEGTGLSVDEEQLNAYYRIVKILLEKLFNVNYTSKFEGLSLERVIETWNQIEEYLSEIFAGLRNGGTYKWEEAVHEGLLYYDLVFQITELQLLRNKVVHSNNIDKDELSSAVKKSDFVRNELKEIIKKRNFFFDPSISEIKGKVSLNYFSGIYYNSIGDSNNELLNEELQETVWMLNLETPINVHQETAIAESGGYNSSQYDIQRVQLALGYYKSDLKKFEGKTVIIKGKFWGAHTSHHYTSVLLDVISIKE
ncbi:DUF4431 domain-containing protein [Mucilaginibacter robiniae]|uniref:DUF4431 domain-containing protein n=1 Tax=Mucilaginibacter robiniae TaxID=2728022 RepID=A0A7L5DY37_9SPHI|nr:DUF4431 domain-containing protein [Mucilaginibacter robiniae]QJD95118.1 DUF4431 domain-containing protein [Mucilaginibacter robiniae]